MVKKNGFFCFWGFVVRKMGELGYNRSAKKCKEKFENIYKYHKRTRDGRSGRANGKNYRFFEQLEALDHQSFDPPSMKETRPASTVPNNVVLNAIPCSVHNPAAAANFVENSSSSTSFSSQESEGARKKKKRKLARFFDRLMKEVMERQESLQRKFLETLEKCEQDRMAREEAWKAQELERIKRESELLVQERAIAAAKDAAVLAFLKKYSEQSDQVQMPQNLIASSEKDSDKQEKSHVGNIEHVSLENQEKSSNNRNYAQMSSSRWPKDEVDALIRLRTNLDLQYQDNGPKGPLWEDISAAMKKLGYDRSAKRCKEKWENINKYFKRVKDNNKKRVEDSKTCPYFHQLDALYNKKTKKATDSVTSGYDMRPEELLMHMMGSQNEQQQQLESVTEDGEDKNLNHNQEENNDMADGDGYQIEADNPSRMTVDNPPSVETIG